MLGLVAPDDDGEEQRLLVPPTRHHHHATAGITLDTYGHLFPSEMEALADRLEQASTAVLANRERTHADQPRQAQ
ncbi:MAG TPA: hypothetical protein VGW74_03895 [Propionibacteriaceae bacterium]|jgi:hypothetical protein|nr:hypothetical protein [Propionibacteriaceae bacterium]